MRLTVFKSDGRIERTIHIEETDRYLIRLQIGFALVNYNPDEKCISCYNDDFERISHQKFNISGFTDNSILRMSRNGRFFAIFGDRLLIYDIHSIDSLDFGDSRFQFGEFVDELFIAGTSSQIIIWDCSTFETIIKSDLPTPYWFRRIAQC